MSNMREPSAWTVQVPPTVPLLQPTALYESVADRLRERIFSHQLKPGDRLDEAALAREFGVSRTPIREAFKVLSNEGLLTGRARHGIAVTVLGAHELGEAVALQRLLQDYARNEGRVADGLLGRMLQVAESRLRLAFGPNYEQRVREFSESGCAS